MDYIGAIEKVLNKEAVKEFLPMQPGDVTQEHDADVSDLIENLGYKPDTPVSLGIEKFIKWYKSYLLNFALLKLIANFSLYGNLRVAPFASNKLFQPNAEIKICQMRK
jgi:hypothetical protein